MPEGYRKETDRPEQLHYEGNGTIVIAAKRDDSWQAVAKATGFLAEEEEVIGFFSTKAAAKDAMLEWMRNHPNGFQSNDSGMLDFGDGGSGGFDTGVGIEGGIGVNDGDRFF